MTTRVHRETPTTALEAGIDAAVAAGNRVRGRTGDNPPVGAALLSPQGQLLSIGATRPAGGAHAEVMALAQAGERARGATAVVTLEPCNHTGRTGPCSQALIEAGVSSVVYLTADPNPLASGGAATLRQAGVEVRFLPRRVEALQPWLTAIRTGRPRVSLKIAQTLDGFSAASDGTSQWITSRASRRHVHSDRVHRDAIVIGTQTALVDDPSLNARDSLGQPFAEALQPRRVVIGSRDVRGRARNLTRLGFESYKNIDEALAALYASGARDVLVEGGPTLISSFLQADVVDQIRVYTAPLLLGRGRSVIGGEVVQTLHDAQRFRLLALENIGDDLVADYVRKDENN